MALQWEQGIPTHKRYLCRLRLLGELSGIARKYVVGKRPDWLSYNGSYELLRRAQELTLQSSQTGPVTVHQDDRVPGHRATSSPTWTTWHRPQQHQGRWSSRHQSTTPQPSTESQAPASEGAHVPQEEDGFYDASEGGFDPWRQYASRGAVDANRNGAPATLPGVVPPP